MVDFVVKERHYCRNPHCRTKLPAPVSNPGRAFCCASCHESFYRSRCLVCECEMARPKRGRRFTCKKAKCRSAIRANPHLASFSVKTLQKSEQNQSRFRSSETVGRRWRIIAGPALTPNQLHCATVPDGPNGQWKGGEYERIEAKNRAALAAAEKAEIEANGEFTEPDWREVVSPDGVMCFVTRFKAPKQPTPVPPMPDDLNVIPAFLRRGLPSEAIPLAA